MVWLHPLRQLRTRVLLTGATGHIGRVVLADLLERGYAVRATTSKAPPEVYDHNGNVEWRTFDFMQATDYDGACIGL